MTNFQGTQALNIIQSGEQVIPFPVGSDGSSQAELRVQASLNYIRIERADGQSIQLIDQENDQTILDKEPAIDIKRPSIKEPWVVERIEVDEQRGRYLNDFLVDIALRYGKSRLGIGIPEHTRHQGVVLV